MSARGAHWTLFVAALLLVPVRLFGIGTAFVPVARILELATVASILLAVEGATNLSLVLVAVFLLQAVAYALLLWFGARLLSRLLGRIFGAQRNAAVWAVVLVTLSWVSLVRVYETPFHSHLPHATLLELYP